MSNLEIITSWYISRLRSIDIRPAINVVADKNNPTSILFYQYRENKDNLATSWRWKAQTQDRRDLHALVRTIHSLTKITISYDILRTHNLGKEETAIVTAIDRRRYGDTAMRRCGDTAIRRYGDRRRKRGRNNCIGLRVRVRYDIIIITHIRWNRKVTKRPRSLF